MQRRDFLTLPATATALAAAPGPVVPPYRVVTSYAAARNPNRYPGSLIQLQSDKVDAATVNSMMARGIAALTGASDARDAWRSFIDPSDNVGIKVNCSGSPGLVSNPLIVAETVRRVIEAGVPARNITIFERFDNQLQQANYAPAVPQGVNIFAFEDGGRRGGIKNYDPATYVEIDFFGEDQTRSFLGRPISRQFTKIVNIPNCKDHGAAGVTGALKNIAYGSFSNMARSHRDNATHTLTFIATLAAVEPLRSKTVLHIMDALKAVWHGGPFCPTERYAFHPRQIWFATDPVTMDRQVLDVIDGKRKAEGACSVWDRSMEHVSIRPDSKNPNQNRYIREPGHIQFAGLAGLGIYDQAKIRRQEISL